MRLQSLWRSALLLALPLVAAVSRAQFTLTEYEGPNSPTFQGGYTMVDLVAGPDGNIWFTENYAFGNQTSIGRISPAGVTTYFPIPSGSSEGGIAPGPDGALWFTEYRTGRIGRIATDGTMTEFPIPGGGYPNDITQGPDGNMWFTMAGGIGQGKVGKITSSGDFTLYAVPSGIEVTSITAGSDGAMWFTEHVASAIGRVTTEGDFAVYSLPNSGSYPYACCLGPDGNVWFVENSGNRIGKITPAGDISEFDVPTPAAYPVSICAGADGNLWFTEENGNNFGRVTPTGIVTEYPIPTPSRCGGIAPGPDGNIWFLESTANKIVKAVLAPSFQVSALYDQNKVHKKGSTAPIKIQVLDGAGGNVSASNLVVHAVNVTLVSGAAPGALDDSGNSNPDYNFRYDPGVGTGGGYVFNLSLKGYQQGTYSLNFKIGSGATLYSVQFKVR